MHLFSLNTRSLTELTPPVFEHMSPVSSKEKRAADQSENDGTTQPPIVVSPDHDKFNSKEKDKDTPALQDSLHSTSTRTPEPTSTLKQTTSQVPPILPQASTQDISYLNTTGPINDQLINEHVLDESLIQKAADNPEVYNEQQSKTQQADLVHNNLEGSHVYDYDHLLENDQQPTELSHIDTGIHYYPY